MACATKIKFLQGVAPFSFHLLILHLSILTHLLSLRHSHFSLYFSSRPNPFNLQTTSIGTRTI